jgi:glycosyltransferase involved in cell wall biosynthesis
MLVRYYGPVGIPSGYGHAATETCMAILAAGLDLEIQTYHPTPGEGRQNVLSARYLPLESCIRHDGVPPTPNPDVVIVHTLPVDCGRVLAAAQIRELYPKAHCVAYTSWEASSISSESAAGLMGGTDDTDTGFDEIWVPSAQTRAALATYVRPVPSVVPHAFDETALSLVPPGYMRDTRMMAARPPRPYRFYWIGAWSRRKNPQGVIQAYLRAFDKNDPVELHMLAAGADPVDFYTCLVAETGKSPADLPRIALCRERVSDEAIWDLHSTSHCYVTASRGEAWNLPCFDAMVVGRHIIAPQSLGSTDYLQHTSAWLYESRLSPAGGEARVTQATGGGIGMQPIGTDLTCKLDWWEPDIGRLAVLMRRAYAETVTDLDVHNDLAERYGRRAVGINIRRHLERVTR